MLLDHQKIKNAWKMNQISQKKSRIKYIFLLTKTNTNQMTTNIYFHQNIKTNPKSIAGANWLIEQHKLINKDLYKTYF